MNKKKSRRYFEDDFGIFRMFPHYWLWRRFRKALLKATLPLAKSFATKLWNGEALRDLKTSLVPWLWRIWMCWNTYMVNMHNVYIYICINVIVCIHTYIHTYIHIYIYIRVCVCLCLFYVLVYGISNYALHTHTCSELPLRIVKWSVSYVQKQSSSPDRNGCEIRRKFSVLILTEGCWSSSNKIRLRKPCRKWWTKNVEVLGLSLFPCQKVIKIDSRYVTVISRDILVGCMELRWRQPCRDPVAPCK